MTESRKISDEEVIKTIEKALSSNVPEWDPEHKQNMLDLLEEFKSRVDYKKVANFTSVSTKDLTLNNSKIANFMHILEVGENEIGVESEADKKKSKEVSVFVTIEHTDDITFKGKSPIEAYDMAVYNGIYSLYVAGNTMFTPAQVHRLINGLVDKEKVMPTSINRIVDSIEKLRFTKVSINYTQQMHKHGKGDKDKNYIIDDFMLSVKRVITTFNGNPNVEGYYINSTPIVSDYSKQFGHLITIPIEQLHTINPKTKTRLKSTPEITVIRMYLAKRIAMMNNTKNNIHNKHITYESIYKNTGIEDVNKDKVKVLKKHIMAILESFKQQKVIKGYEEYKAKGSRSWTGMKIKL